MDGADGVAVGNDRVQGLRRPADAVGRVGDEGGPTVWDLGVHFTVHHLVAAPGIRIDGILEDGRRIGVDGSVGEVVPVTGVDDRFFPDQPVPGGGVAQNAFDLPALGRLLLLDEVGVPHLEDPLRLVVEDRTAVELLGLPGPVGNHQGIVRVFHGPFQDFAGAPELLDDVIVDKQLLAADDDGIPQDRVVQIPERSRSRRRGDAIPCAGPVPSLQVSGVRLRPRVLRSLVSPPAQFLAPPLCAGHDVEKPVAVEVGQQHLIGAGPILLQDAGPPEPASDTRVFEPRDTAGGTPGRGRGVVVSVSVQVTGHHLEGVLKTLGQQVLGPGARRGLPCVLIPGDLMGSGVPGLPRACPGP